MKNCPFCGAELKDDSLFCTECGKELPKGVLCPHCGASVNEGDTFCTECGKKIDEVPQITSSEPIKPKCPHCGASMNEGDVFCTECGKKIGEEEEQFPMDEVVQVEEPKPIQQETSPIEEVEDNDISEEYEEEPSSIKKYLPFVIGGIVVLALIIGFFVLNNSNNEPKNQQIEAVDSVMTDSKSTDESDEIQERIKFIENFYKNLESSNWDAFVRNNVDANAHRTLNQAYDYECESDDCLAIWLFTKGDCSDPGVFISRNIKMKDIDTYLVENEYENVKYIVSLTLHKYGDIYKISDIEEIETAFIERHSTDSVDVVDTSEKNIPSTESDESSSSCWYVYGSLKELQGQKILSGNTVNTKSLNKDYFTEISKDEQKTIKLYSKNVEIMTSHPSDSYNLNLVNGNYQLTITDPSSFWSQSRYLVVVLE